MYFKYRMRLKRAFVSYDDSSNGNCDDDDLFHKR